MNEARRTFGEQVLTFTLCFCHWQLALFPGLQVILQLGTRKVARGNIAILSPKLRYQISVAPYSTDNRRNVHDSAFHTKSVNDFTVTSLRVAVQCCEAVILFSVLVNILIITS